MQFETFLDHLLSLLEKETNQIVHQLLRKSSESFAASVYQFAPVQETSTAKSATFLKILYKIERVLRVNETKPPCTNAFLVEIFLLESRKASRNEERTLFWDSSWSQGLFLNTQPPKDTLWRFPGLIVFQPFFGHLLFLLQKKNQSIRFCTKFYAKVATILRPKCASLLLRRKPVQRNRRHFKNSFTKQCSFLGLRKLNHLAKMLFLLIFFYQKVKKDPEMKKEPCFGSPR